MKTIMLFACIITLLTTNGCVVAEGRHGAVIAPVVPVPVPVPVPVR